MVIMVEGRACLSLWNSGILEMRLLVICSGLGSTKVVSCLTASAELFLKPMRWPVDDGGSACNVSIHDTNDKPGGRGGGRAPRQLHGIQGMTGREATWTTHGWGKSQKKKKSWLRASGRCQTDNRTSEEGSDKLTIINDESVSGKAALACLVKLGKELVCLAAGAPS